MRQINEVIVHCTATRPDWWATRTTNQKVAEIRRWHTSPPKNWKDIGYHYLIDRDGTVVTGRPVEQVGAHVQGRNTGTIGVALFGGHGSAETDQFTEHFTPEQDKALGKLLLDLHRKFGTLTVSGHNQFAAKACPGFNVRAWYGLPSTSPIIAPAPTPARKPAPGLWAALWALLARILGRSK